MQLEIYILAINTCNMRPLTIDKHTIELGQKCKIEDYFAPAQIHPSFGKVQHSFVSFRTGSVIFDCPHMDTFAKSAKIWLLNKLASLVLR